MKIAIASDHAGFEQKQAIVDYLCDEGHDVADFGPKSEGRVDYPDFAKLVSKSVATKDAEFGVLVCGTGIGMAISANKIKGIRAVGATSTEFAKLSREHNDANVLCLSGRFVDLATNLQCVDVFLATKFEGGRHEIRVKKIMALEDENDD